MYVVTVRGWCWGVSIPKFFFGSGLDEPNRGIGDFGSIREFELDHECVNFALTPFAWGNCELMNDSSEIFDTSV